MFSLCFASDVCIFYSNHSAHSIVGLFHIAFVQFFLFFCVFFAFLGTHRKHMEVPSLGMESAVAFGLHHSHSNASSEPHLQPIAQLTAMQDP